MPTPHIRQRLHRMMGGIIGGGMGATRDRREADNCDEDNLKNLEADYEQCALNAYTTYTTAFTQNDGRPQFYERKSCNYLTEVIEECPEIFADCYDEEQLNELKDKQVESTLEKIEAAFEDWDSQKCPAAKNYLDRKAAKEAPQTEPEADPTASATSLSVSILSILLIATII